MNGYIGAGGYYEGDRQGDDTAVPRRPSSTHEWNGTAWVRNITRDRADGWVQIKAERDRRKSGGVLVSGKWFHTDPDSRIQQLGLVLMGASVPSVPWKTLDGSFTPMSQSLATAIFQAVAALDMALFAKAEEHRTAMLAAELPEEYNWRTGWPAAFGE